MVQCDSLKDAERAGRPVRAEFGQPLSFLGRVHGLLSPYTSYTDNVNVNVQRVSGHRECKAKVQYPSHPQSCFRCAPSHSHLRAVLALTETSVMWAVSETDLATLEPVDVSVPASSAEVAVISTAHVMHHAASATTVRTYTRFAKGLSGGAYEVVLLPDEPAAAAATSAPASGAAVVASRPILASVPPGRAGGAEGLSAPMLASARRARFHVDRPAYQHSFALTEDYVILVEQVCSYGYFELGGDCLPLELSTALRPLLLQPLLFSLGSLLWNVVAGGTLLNMFRWEGSGGRAVPTYFRVIRLSDLVEVGDPG
jgi:hypothetical protein